MKIQHYIADVVAAFPKVVTPEIISPACIELGVSPTDFCNYFAKEVSCAYHDGQLSWLEADTAMNALSGFFFVHLPKEAPFPDYAYGVFLAFDAGEVYPPPENERITRDALASLHAKA